MVPKQEKIPFQKFSSNEQQIIDLEIQKLIKLKVICEAEYHNDQFISPNFTRPKRMEFRMILYLKELTKYVKIFHFKMDTFETALN